ncbi:MAG: hypothetical protein H7315_16520 [Herminiimonas sp.]|nr:hypothetical protein [Herminiimonas sp.]
MTMPSLTANSIATRRPIRYHFACAAVALMALLHGPATAQPIATTMVVELPAVSGWFQGRAVQYVTTDVSDKDAAVAMGANFVPRLANAIPAQPLAPGQFSALERIYSFTNFKQGGVLPSVPEPTGPANVDRSYSPLWLVHKVTWLPNNQPRVLKSEEEVLDAAEKKQVSVVATNIVVNCPVIFSAGGGMLPNAKIVTR